ncbi:MAG: hypothetical protein JW910_12620 [Anaerolineae bacterium]|nr:hypothetical protein [Anaerolineae bacterium]
MSAQPKTDRYTFEVNGASVTLARRTNRHALHIDRVLLALGDSGDDAADRGYKRLFAKAVVQTVEVDGELGLALPQPTAPADELQAAYKTFLDADGSIGDAFYAGLNAVNAPLGPREFLPPGELSEADQKNSPSAAASGATSGGSSSGGS